MENNIVANIKSLGIDMIKKAGSGHPGIVLSAAPIIYTIYAKHMHVNPKDPNWINRDRFIMSAGHGSALLYSTLYMAGFISLGDLKNFRMIDSRTPGHPEYGITPGVDMSTGPLGQGIASAVGFAIAEKKLKTEYPDLISYYTYVLCGDGDLMEGISYEAASLAGHLKLDNLIVLYDSNNISLDGNVNCSFTENVRERFEALGWYTIFVKNNRVSDIDKAICRAKKSGLPTLIEVKSVLGEGSMLENTNKVHGKPLTDDDINRLKESLSIDKSAFYVNEEALQEFRKQISNRSEIKYSEWTKKYNTYVLENKNNLLDAFINKSYDFNITLNDIDVLEKEALRDCNYKIMNVLANRTNLLFGGSADLASSCKTYLDAKGDFQKENYNGQNIWFGVREHSMGAILNGLALSGYMPYGSTFLSFSDYVKPAIRMSALMNLPVTYIFTHDGIIGQDGPTHQSIEQLSSLRLIPNLTVYRPADIKELLGAWKCIFERKQPSSLIISKKETYTLKSTDVDKVKFGAYIALKEREKIDAILLSTGSELETAFIVAFELKKEGKDIRVVSMPSLELFKTNSLKYRNEVLPAGKKVIVIEAGSSFELRDFVSNNKYLITLNEFGYSGKVDDVSAKMNFSTKQIIDRIRKLL